ncbi:MAG: hypothetical protein RI911_225 [Candidatus Parcubacteria bacterium]|jgi:hypothetical protein
MDDQAQRVLRQFQNHDRAVWDRFQGSERRQIFNVAESIRTLLLIKALEQNNQTFSPTVSNGIVDVCIIKVCEHLLEASPQEPMRAFTPDLFQNISTAADALYELGYNRRGGQWDMQRLWTRMQHQWSWDALHQGHERRIQQQLKKHEGEDIRERDVIEVFEPGYYLARLNTPPSFVGEGMLADNCVADYIDKKDALFYSIRRSWDDLTLSPDEKSAFLRTLCIYTDKKGRETRKTAGVAALLRARAGQTGQELSLKDSVTQARKMNVTAVKTMLIMEEARVRAGVAMLLDVDIPLVTLQVTTKGQTAHMLTQALGPKNKSIDASHPQYQQIMRGLEALKKNYYATYGRELGTNIPGLPLPRR